MPIANIIDRRTCPLNVNIDAVFEPSFHDNESQGATQFSDEGELLDQEEFDIDSIYDTTIEKSIEFAQKWKIPVTLFLYDAGSKPV